MKTNKKTQASVGTQMYNLMETLFPICRSITGQGVRKTLHILQNIIPLSIHEVPTGTKVYDWTIPKEWNIKDAYIKNSNGEKIIDFQKSNIHVLNYSAPVKKKCSLKELKKNLHTLPEYPDWIPYLTTYYKENWGFCLSHKQYQSLKEDTYEAVIDSTLSEGSLTYGEFFIPGENEEEILLSTYLCHPSLCNDNLTGVVLLAYLAKHLINKKLRYSYRFLFIPETIGAITWLSRNEDKQKKIRHGLVITCVGDPGMMTYKKTRSGNAEIDKAVEKVLMDSGEPFKIIDFFPSGSDERQYCSPGINLQVGSLMRTPYGQYPEQHTSADNLNYIKADCLQDSFEKYIQTLNVLEKNDYYLNQNPKCEPQLGRRGLYRLIGSQKTGHINEFALFWVLNFSDGKHSLLDIAHRSKMTFEQISRAADALLKKDLLKKK